MATRLVGRSVPRKEGRAKVTGAARYVDDLRLPDMIHEAWDRYAADDVALGDVVVFAVGEWDQAPRRFSVEAEEARQSRGARNGGRDRD